jgi:sugar phosphate isomerase/epimerase
MQRFGFKIVDQSRSEIEPVLDLATRDGRPIEVGLYFGDREARRLLLERLPGSGLPVAVHVDHRRLSLFDLRQRESELCEQLDFAARLGADYVIDHFSMHPLSARPAHREALVERIGLGLDIALRRCGESGLGLHIENVFEEPDFQRELFRDLAAAGFPRLGACFDIGHAKVWSTATLSAWLDLLADWQVKGHRLHFHLHANRGLVDEHLSFLTADRLGIAGPDSYTEGLDYYQALAEIGERFPDASKVFEVPAGEAERNLDHVLGCIAAGRADAVAARAAGLIP